MPRNIGYVKQRWQFLYLIRIRTIRTVRRINTFHHGLFGVC